MRRPRLITYLFGNPISLIALIVAAIYAIYEWWADRGSPWMALIAFFAASSAITSSERLLAYRQWKREWAAMEGKPPRRRMPTFTWLRPVIGIGVWSPCAYLALTEGTKPGMQVAALLFWLATAIIGVTLLVRLFRRKHPQAKTVKDVPVTVCIAVPKHAPNTVEARMALPDYCKSLMIDAAERAALRVG